MTLETQHRLPLEDFPIPAYRLIDMRQYFLGSIQFSTGCPFLCEFRVPRHPRAPRPQAPAQNLRRPILESVKALNGHDIEVVSGITDNPNRATNRHKPIAGDIRKGVGVRANCREQFWKVAKPLFAAKRIEEVLHIAIVAHHLIQYTRATIDDDQEPAFTPTRIGGHRRRIQSGELRSVR